MKSTLSIFVSAPHPRTIEVPCRLPEAFNFKFKGRTLSVEVDGALPEDLYPYRVECDAGPALTADEFSEADAQATAILTTIKATLGITGPVPLGSPLPAIALAYEAECAAYEAAVKAHRELPRLLHSPALLPAHPSDIMGGAGYSSHAVEMLSRYVEHVVEQAAKVTP